MPRSSEKSRKFCSMFCYKAAGGQNWKEQINGRRDGSIKNKTTAQIKKDYKTRHREKVLKSGRAYYYKTTDAHRNRALIKRYGITLSKYREMLANQARKCAICGGQGKSRWEESPLVIDHNHTTKQVRELLCSSCNAMVGFIETNPDKVDKIRVYLEKHHE